MSRPASAARYRCHTRTLSFGVSFSKPSAYSWTTAASSICSRRYRRSVTECGGRVGCAIRLPLKRDFYPFAMLRHVHAPAEGGFDPLLQRVLRRRFAVNQIRRRRWSRERSQPLHDLGGIGMRRNAVQFFDMCRHEHLLPVDLDGLYAVDQLTPACPLCLIADEQDGVAGIGQTRREVMEHAAACGHATGGNHDGGTV